jgi:ArsR family transcriptional regulator
MDQVEEIAELFKAFSDVTRLRLIKLLMDGRKPLCVNALSSKLGVTQSAVSQHLRILRQAGLVRGDRHGYHVHYSVERTKLQQCEKLFHKTFGRALNASE